MTPSPQPAVETPPSVVILGSDALLAALPATPTQLMNACYAAGYEGVFPASWGDELVAAGCLKNLETRIGPAILCACPLVSEQLRGVAPLQRFQLHLISPPVAAARYLRALCDDSPLRVTYVGDCPGADDPAIDERVSPSEFLKDLINRSIAPSAQRPDLGANAPRDRRRFYSLPGGAPTPEWLSADWPKRTLVDVDAGDALADLAHHALARESTLIDFAPQLGCACSGAVGGIPAGEARRAVAALEPPRSRQEVLDPGLRVPVEGRVPLAPTGSEVSWDEFLASLPRTLAADGEGGEEAVSHPGAVAPPPLRRSREGSVLPRAYSTPRAPRRRSSAIDVTADAGAMPTEAIEVPVAATPRASVSAMQAMSAMPAPVAAGPVPSALPVAPSARSTAAVPAAGQRTTQPIPRRAGPIEGTSGPRYGTPPRAMLTTSDRWMLFAVMVGGSMLSAALTSYITVRALGGRLVAAPAAAGPRRDSVPSDRGASLDAASSAEVAAAASSAPLTPTPPPLGDQRALTTTRATQGAGAPPSPRARTQATRPPARSAVAAATVAPSPPRVAVAPPAPQPSPAAAPAAVAPLRDTSTRVAVDGQAPGGAAATVVDAPVPVPVSAPPSTSTGGAAGAAGAASTAVAGSAPVPAPAAAPAAAPPVDVAAELRAIREELARRSRRVDSLTKALDSMAVPPRAKPPR